MKIKTSDTVLVTTGKYKGKTGNVLRVVADKKQVVVEKVNIRTKHVRKTANNKGDKIKYEAPIDASNVMLICPQCSKAVRVGYQIPEKGKKIRVCKKCSATVDKTFAKKKTK